MVNRNRGYHRALPLESTSPTKHPFENTTEYFEKLVKLLFSTIKLLMQNKGRKKYDPFVAKPTLPF